MRKIQIVTGVIKKDGKYLLLKRSPNCRTNRNKWQFPEGKVESGESYEDALRRELKEETSLKLLRCTFLKVHSYVKYYPEIQEELKITRYIYYCEVEGEITLSNEHAEYGWFSKEGIKNLDTIDGLDLVSFIP